MDLVGGAGMRGAQIGKGARFNLYTGRLTNAHTTGERLRSEGPQRKYRFLHVGPATSLITDLKKAEAALVALSWIPSPVRSSEVRRARPAGGLPEEDVER